MSDKAPRWHIYKFEVFNPLCCERKGPQVSLQSRRMLSVYVGAEGFGRGEWRDIGTEPGDIKKFLCEHGRAGEVVIRDVRRFRYHPRYNEVREAKKDMGMLSKDEE